METIGFKLYSENADSNTSSDLKRIYSEHIPIEAKNYHPEFFEETMNDAFLMTYYNNYYNWNLFVDGMYNDKFFFLTFAHVIFYNKNNQPMFKIKWRTTGNVDRNVHDTINNFIDKKSNEIMQEITQRYDFEIYNENYLLPVYALIKETFGNNN